MGCTFTCLKYSILFSYYYLLLHKNNKKTFSIKVKGMSKPKKHANKVGKLTYDPKLNKPLPYNPT